MNPLRYINIKVNEHIHVIPLNDNIVHRSDDKCLCHPRSPTSHIHIHHAVDDRYLYTAGVLKWH